ncbi:oxidoreductase [Pseudonocardia sp. K10HN5]|uniref:Oxidoreductase n=2 Tax=Pseudonocardia acidicola TaxID=2724939 RepID=A0ABX1SB61_9PSEU|nr:FAD/NAD(P)-binding protein [Pseudonocardia acidicola]NMH97606.1 oxidoreductase [Pseudonocardia acidicola]
MVPVPYRVVGRRVETRDSVTLHLEPVTEALPAFRPGQFTMLYRRGVGEVAISISGDPTAGDGSLTQTIRDVGAVSRALHAAGPGDVLGARGPYGTGWGLETAVDHDLVIVAGGVGLAPLRPVLLGALARRGSYRRIMLVAGARNPSEFLFREQLDAWSGTPGLEVELTIDQPAEGWSGPVGFVTESLTRLTLDPARTVAFLCGPEPMMRFSANVLQRKGVDPGHIRVSLERNMKCGVGLCGHCQLGPLLVCRDGPVVDYARAQPLLAVREL